MLHLIYSRAKAPLWLLACLLLVLASCRGGRTSADDAAAGGDTVRFRYARNIRVVRHADYTRVDLADPWKPGRTLHTYLLVARGSRPQHLPAGTRVDVPLERAVVFTAAHASLLFEWGKAGSIGGVCDVEYILNDSVRSRVRDGRIRDMGSALNPDVERIVALKPDAILLSPFENSGGYGRVEKTGVPLVEVADYMEQGPLARAEWMRFYGMLFGCEPEAEALFAEVEKQYLALRAKAARAVRRPSVMSDMMSSGTWYVPGGRSTTARLIADAGGAYVFAQNEDAGSVARTFESVFAQAAEADIWILRSGQAADPTYAQLLSDYRPYGAFKAFRTRRIYNCNTLHKPYYDVVAFHPEAILRDLILVFHPELRLGGQPRFFEPLAE